MQKAANADRAAAKAELISASTLLGPATAFIVLGMIVPLTVLLRYSFNRFDRVQLMQSAFTLENYTRFFGDVFYSEILWTTCLIAVGSTALSMALSLPIAYRLARTNVSYKSLLIVAIVLPLFISGTIRAIGWMILFNYNGPLNQVARLFSPGVVFDLMFTPTAVIIGLISMKMPYLILTLQSVFEGIDTRLEDAAGSLGAAPSTVFWRIVWPMAMPGIMIGCILSFILTMNVYATPVLLGGPRFKMMAPLLYWEFSTQNNWPMAAVIAFILMATTITLSVLASKVVRRR